MRCVGMPVVVFYSHGCMMLQRIKRERCEQEKSRQTRKLMITFVTHACIQLFVLAVMMGLFCGFQALSFPARYECSLGNTTLSPLDQVSINITCNDLRYKEKTKVNIVIITIMAISIICCIVTGIHLISRRKVFLQQFVGEGFALDDENSAGVCIEGEVIKR